MSERKVLNKYFPPDFDPAKIPRRKMPKDQQHTVRLMTPFSMRCNTCGEYVYKGKKFNARKERVIGEDYLGIQIFRFYIKCPVCSTEITFKTDPKNADYVAEHGAQRNFEPWRDDGGEEERKAERAAAEENNPIKALENRTLDSKREMDILDALDEIRTRNARNERVDADALLDKLIVENEDFRQAAKRRQEEEDDRLAKAIFQSADGELVKRIMDDDDDEPDGTALGSIGIGAKGLTSKGMEGSDARLPKAAAASPLAGLVAQPKRKADPSSLGIVRKKAKPDTQEGPSQSSKSSGAVDAVSALAAIGGYGDSDSE
ncbi:hypothetical protein HK104_002122 [Borealophlyctis nickersoniae]|nr:hypothetical protein HK104_002122 [Borealophlyctis nickersoniae]